MNPKPTLLYASHNHTIPPPPATHIKVVADSAPPFPFKACLLS